MPGIQKYRTPSCLDCEKDVDPNAQGVWVLVQGWAENRTAGGTHALKDRISLKQFVCAPCMMEREWSKTHQSSSLF